MIDIRKSFESDVQGLKEVLDTIELFPSEMLEDMMADYFNNADTEDIWFTALQNGQICGLGYCAAEKLTDRTYNLYAIGIKNALQGQGIGKQMMAFIEAYLSEKGGRILIVDTSSLPEYAQTRDFYQKIGYSKEAVIRDFWKEGDDKVTFWKKL